LKLVGMITEKSGTTVKKWSSRYLLLLGATQSPVITWSYELKPNI
jgi:hypothetical protein